MKKHIDLNIPVNFEKIKEYQVLDTRFIQCKIFLMHTGENLNGSLFEKSVVESAMPTLANTPILAYIEENKDGEDDFTDHRQVLEIKNNKIKVSYKGKAIGVIPETNNAHFEMRVCDDGVEREFLTCTGLLWSKFDDSAEIFDRDKNKQESMELHDDYTGHFNKNNYFVFDSFKFYGACALGDDVAPAMRSASIDTVFTMSEIKNKLDEFTNYINSQSSFEVDIEKQDIGKEDEILTDKINETIVEITEEFSEVVEPVVETVNTDIVETIEITEVVEETVEIEVKEEVVEEFKEDIIETVLKSDFDKLNSEFEEYKLNYSISNTEVDDLKEFKRAKLENERTEAETELFEKFDDELSSIEEYSKLKEKANEFSIEQLEEKMFVILGKKNANFSVKSKINNTIKIPVTKEDDEVEDPYGGVLAKKYK